MSSSPRVVLGVSGGVAAYKAVEVCRRLMDAGCYVQPVLTDSATRFIGAATFAAVASEPPRVSLWESPEPSPHTMLGQGADVIVVAPATARILASYALGLSDDLLATTLLATRAPVVMAPAMHTEMWEQPSVQANVALLRQRGVTIIEPESGHLAGGDQGVGRLAEPAKIADAVLAVLQGDLAGVHVLVTAGGTREPVDPVRYLGNRSSGKQGHAVAEVAAARGAQVTLISTAEFAAQRNIVVERVETAAQMHDAVVAHLPAADVVVMAAAVADFRPAEAADRKLKKHDGVPQIELEPTVDILSAIADKRRNDQVIVGFAAETHDVESYALDKLKRKKLDLLVANDVTADGAGFGHVTNSVVIFDQSGQQYATGLVEKRTVADTLLSHVAELRKSLLRTQR